MEALSPSVFVTLFFKFSGSADFFEKKEQKNYPFCILYAWKKTRLCTTTSTNTNNTIAISITIAVY